MAKDTVAIKLDGLVSLADFRTVIDAFSELMRTLTAEINPEVTIDWLVSDLKGGSTSVVSRGFFGDNFEARDTVEATVEKYLRLATSAEEGKLEDFSEAVRFNMSQITSVVNGQIPSIRMGADGEHWQSTIKRRLDDGDVLENVAVDDVPKHRPMSRVAIKGRIVSLDEKHGTYFGLSEAYSGRLIRCYPTQKFRGELARYWTTQEYVIVEGTFSRYSERSALRLITDIVSLGDSEAGGWRQAIGCAPRHPNGSDASTADVIRKARDGEE